MDLRFGFLVSKKLYAGELVVKLDFQGIYRHRDFITAQCACTDASLTLLPVSKWTHIWILRVEEHSNA